MGPRFFFILFFYPPHSINAALLFKARENYKAPPPSLYHPFAIIFARELARLARHERLRDIIPRGARPSSSINASTLLTLPQIREDERRGSLTRFSCGKGEGTQYLSRDQREFHVIIGEYAFPGKMSRRRIPTP